MPFQLSQPTHIFSKTDDGAVQKEVVRDPKNHEQLSLVRAHLGDFAAAFAQRHHSRPTEIHGAVMPGLGVRKNPKPGDILVVDRDITDGGQITYRSRTPQLVEALHQWDAQLSDHGHDAMEGHDHNHPQSN